MSDSAPTKNDAAARSAVAASDGGQAFPGEETIWEGGDLTGYIERHRVVKGMSLRDYFAAKALLGIISHPQGKAGQWEEAAMDAYAAADAMLKARVE